MQLSQISGLGKHELGNYLSEVGPGEGAGGPGTCLVED